MTNFISRFLGLNKSFRSRRQVAAYASPEPLEVRRLPAPLGVAINQGQDSYDIVARDAFSRISINQVSATRSRLTSSHAINGRDSSFEFDTNYHVSVTFRQMSSQITIQGLSPATPMRFQSLTINTSSGPNKITINNIYVDKSLNIDAGDGMTTMNESVTRVSASNVGQLLIKSERTMNPTLTRHLSPAYDNIWVTSCTVRGDFTLLGDSARNEFYVNSTVVHGNATVFTGNERNDTSNWTDYFATSNSQFKKGLTINTGEGWGRVNLTRTTAQTITVRMGASSRDELWLYSVTATTIDADAGVAFGSALGSGNIFAGEPKFRNFHANSVAWRTR